MSAPTASRPKALIFRNEMLPSSETFILAQASALRSFAPVFVGVHAARHSLALRPEPTLLSLSDSIGGKVLRRWYWRTSFAPSFHRTLRTLEPSLIDAHFALDGAAALGVRSALKIPLVVTLHGYDVSSSDQSLARSPEGRLYLRRREEFWKQASVFLCISEFIRQRALAKGFPREKLRVHYTGTDMEMFRYDAGPRDRDMVLFVGRFVEKKGCLHLLDALAAVREEHPSVRLVLIGSGPLEQKLRERAAAANLPCEFLGMQPAHVVKDYMSRARVFCAPSITAASGDSEGLGMVFVEAQAMGTPVVSFNHGGISEVVTHGRSGLLAREGDSEGLAVNLLRLLRDDDVWEEFSAFGRRDVHERFDIERQTAQLEEIYRQVLRDGS